MFCRRTLVYYLTQLSPWNGEGLTVAEEVYKSIHGIKLHDKK